MTLQELANIDNVGFRQEGVGVGLAHGHRSVIEFIARIIERCGPAKIAGGVVGAVTITVCDLMARWTRTMECYADKIVDHATDPEITSSKRHRQISSRNAGRHQYPTTRLAKMRTITATGGYENLPGF